MKTIINNYYFLLFTLITLISFPHFLTTNDIWDGTILRNAMELRDYDLLYAFFSETNMSSFVIIFWLISNFKTILNLEISLVINFFSVLLIIFSLFSFNIFLINALKVDKNIAFIVCTFSALLPFFALLNSSLLIFTILNPSLVFLSIGIFYKKNYIIKAISLLLLFYVCTYPLMFPFAFILVTISIITNNQLILKKKNYPRDLVLYLGIFFGVISYMFFNTDITAGYKSYPDIDNIIFGILRFNDYLIFFYPCLIIPIVMILLNALDKPIYTVIIIVTCFMLIIVSLGPYVYFNKQPICMIDYNCKENIYGFKERHTILIYFSFMTIISIGLNLTNKFSYSINLMLISLSAILIAYSLLPIHILNHNRNILRQIWMKNISEELLRLPSNFNYIQILMPNDQILYRMRNYDIQYLASEVEIRNKLFQVNLVDSRVPNRKNKDYFIVPNQPDFSIKTKKIIESIEKFGINHYDKQNFINEFSKVCAARYILLDPNIKYDIDYSINNEKLHRQRNTLDFKVQDYFNMLLNNKSKWKSLKEYHEVELRLLEYDAKC